MDKLRTFEHHFLNTAIRRLSLDIGGYKTRFIVKKGLDFTPLEAAETAYFFTEHKINFVRDFKAKTYIIDDPLSVIQDDLDPSKFFRINRQYIVNSAAIEKFSSIENGKIRVFLNPPTGDEVIIGKETAVKFRKWIHGNF